MSTYDHSKKMRGMISSHFFCELFQKHRRNTEFSSHTQQRRLIIRLFSHTKRSARLCSSHAKTHLIKELRSIFILQVKFRSYFKFAEVIIYIDCAGTLVFGENNCKILLTLVVNADRIS